jgi:hypothetical protein
LKEEMASENNDVDKGKFVKVVSKSEMIQSSHGVGEGCEIDGSAHGDYDKVGVDGMRSR